MKLPCPACGAVCSLEAWFNDQAFRAMVVAAAEAAEIAGARVVRYVGLFRPKTRSLSPDKAAKLFSEIRDLAKTRELNWDRKGLRRISPAIWGEAIDRMLANPPSGLPLANHNYLRAIAWAMADEADRAHEAERTSAENSGTWKRSGSSEPQGLGQVLDKIAGSADCVEPLLINEDASTIWGAAKRLLAQRLPRQVFEMWINPMRSVSETDANIVLIASNAFAARWVGDNYQAEIERSIADATGKPLTATVQPPM